MSVLVCGGAGYIGSHNVRALLDRGEGVVVLDNLWTGHRESLPGSVPFYEGDVRDAALLDRILSEHPVESVIHFCACSLVGESVEQPLRYFNNNVYGMQVLLEAMERHGLDKIVFSSSAAVYGEPRRVPILEDDETAPTNPYGETKRTMERMMHWVGLRHGIRYVSLRYFNVAGAREDGSIGEDHRNETHLVPIILQVPLSRRTHVTVYGDDYPTPDGTCIRDYVHISDLADAHLRALDHLRAGGEGGIFNLGSGAGYSVREMIEAARAATGHAIPVEVGPRRAGDPARLVADSTRAREVLGWVPRVTRMEDIVATAWNWHRTHPNGYGG
ncbi:UDP-glucose 4-epimerase GalE [Fretibacterium sp. OH1220_COT-178]|uniref:UDP-glucose 4-epimerase GalE n=1 Tax=Fretibacterium sp. OH1220_COT-178 TaxID=2491047 RepID=UPI000F5E71B4|nr:UDP-glucose 4-epimerase GalE [Fretibacterium sp. OH1220_COT-178]RRD63905.1 UDP-glucose 4-epimerase GalE [Fretibacterium sp. OH1220_COT-178]